MARRSLDHVMSAYVHLSLTCDDDDIALKLLGSNEP